MLVDLSKELAPSLVIIHNDNFDFIWNLEQYNSVFNLEYMIIKGLQVDNTLVGYYVVSDLDIIEIQALVIFKEFRRLHYSNILLEEIINQAKISSKNILLEVSINNKAASSLYFKYGFKQINIRKDYYAKDNHALILQYSIEE